MARRQMRPLTSQDAREADHPILLLG